MGIAALKPILHRLAPASSEQVPACGMRTSASLARRRRAQAWHPFRGHNPHKWGPCSARRRRPVMMSHNTRRSRAAHRRSAPLATAARRTCCMTVYPTSATCCCRYSRRRSTVAGPGRDDPRRASRRDGAVPEPAGLIAERLGAPQPLGFGTACAGLAFIALGQAAGFSLRFCSRCSAPASAPRSSIRCARRSSRTTIRRRAARRARHLQLLRRCRQVRVRTAR